LIQYKDKYLTEVKKESIILLSKKITQSVILLIINTFIVLVVFFNIIESYFLFIWSFLTISINLIRLFNAKKFLKDTTKYSISFDRATIRNTYIAVFIFSLGTSWLSYQDTGHYELIVILMITSISAGIPANLSTHYKLAKNYLIILVTPSIIIHLLRGDEISVILAIMFILLLFTFTKMSKSHHENTMNLMYLMLNLKDTNMELVNANKHINDSISYASFMQKSILPKDDLLINNFSDYFIYWEPKDVVGGDIYFIDKINENEILIMNIDCTGHGVTGAFVTMLIKAIQSEVISKINHNKMTLSPKKILSYFDKKITQSLNQDNQSELNMGFDGQIVLINKSKQEVLISSARNDVFYIQNDKLSFIKGDRKSIGYRDSHQHTFKEYTLSTSDTLYLYLSSDGYWDQIGGDNHFTFSKKRLKSILKGIYKKDMKTQKEELIKELENYKRNNIINDDISFIGLKIN